MIAHIGSGSMQGHYVAMVRKRSEWVLFDDEEVSPIGEEMVKLCYGSGESRGDSKTSGKKRAASQVSYILFYEALEDAIV